MRMGALLRAAYGLDGVARISPETPPHKKKVESHLNQSRSTQMARLRSLGHWRARAEGRAAGRKRQQIRGAGTCIATRIGTGGPDVVWLSWFTSSGVRCVHICAEMDGRALHTANAKQAGRERRDRRWFIRLEGRSASNVRVANSRYPMETKRLERGSRCS